MLKSIKNKMLQITEACGLEISLIENGEPVMQAVVLKSERNKIVKNKETLLFSSLEDLHKLIPVGVPIAVTLAGKGVLHKKVTREAMTDNILESILPNSNPADFYMDICDYGTSISLYVARKSTIDKVIDTLIDANFNVLSVDLGTSALQNLLPFVNLENQNQKIITNHYKITLDENKKIVDIDQLPFSADGNWPPIEYSVGDQYVFSRGILSFASAAGLLAGTGLGETVVDNLAIAAAREDYRYYKYFKTAAWAYLVFFFFALLVNFLVFTYYSRANDDTYALQMMNLAEQKKAQKLALQISSKESFLDRNGWSHQSRISFYADRIAALLPDNATLTNLKINPLNNAFMGGDLLRFQMDTIQITGNCEDPADLNRFANNLRNIKDFKEINIKSYIYKKETQKGLFSIEIRTI